MSYWKTSQTNLRVCWEGVSRRQYCDILILIRFQENIGLVDWRDTGQSASYRAAVVRCDFDRCIHLSNRRVPSLKRKFFHAKLV